MKKVLISALIASLGVLTIALGPSFVSGDQRTESLIEQIDLILTSDKFENKIYTQKIQTRATKAATVFSQGSLEQLIMMYISEKLKTKIIALEHAEIVEAQKLAKIEAQKQIALAQGGSEEQSDHAYEGSNPYFRQAEQEHAAAEPMHESAGSLGAFNMGKTEAPKTEKKKRVSYATPDYRYKIGSFLYNKECVQLACINSCMNKFDKELDECNEICTSRECQETVRRSRGIEKYAIEFEEE